jgi:hypothetical protein
MEYAAELLEKSYRNISPTEVGKYFTDTVSRAKRSLDSIIENNDRYKTIFLFFIL